MRNDPLYEGMRWLEQAEADPQGAQLLFDGESHHLACFVSQQVAEKALKAFLYAEGEEVVIGHSVDQLCRWAAESDPAFGVLREEAAAPDRFRDWREEGPAGPLRLAPRPACPPGTAAPIVRRDVVC